MSTNASTNINFSVKQAVSKEECVLTCSVTGWVTHELLAGPMLVSIDKSGVKGQLPLQLHIERLSL